MSAKKGRAAKMPPAAADDSEAASSLDNFDSANLSAIEKASFMEGLQVNYGNPLHSTAVEEDLEVLEEGCVNKGRAGKKDIPAKRRGAAKKRKETKTDGESEKEKQQPKKKKTTGGRVKARPEKGGVTEKKKGATEGERGQSDVEGMESDPSAAPQESIQPTPTAACLKRMVGKKPAKARSVRPMPAARPVKNSSQEESESYTGQQRHKRVLSSDDVAMGDTSLKPSPKTHKVYSLGRTRMSSSGRSKSRESSSGRSKSRESSSGRSKSRESSSGRSKSRESSSGRSKSRESLSGRSKSRKSSSGRSKSRKSSSGTASAEPKETNRVERKKKKKGQGGTQLEEVLDAFLDFCDQYRESVDSKAVKQSIDYFSNNVREQLMEKISSHKELMVLKRKNVKVGSLIRTKTQRLLDAKHELMRAERQVRLLKKEKAELKLRLDDLRRSHSFLHDTRELNRHYLDYRQTHPEEKETYGASSLPALLLEARHIRGAEHQLKGINNQLEKRLKENVK